MALTDKQKAFVAEYIKDFNAKQAALRCGYSAGSAHSTGHKLLKEDKIKLAISDRLEEMAMSAEEALARLAQQARGSHSAYLLEDGTYDLPQMIEDGMGHLVQGIRNTHKTQTIKFVDSQAALLKIVEIHGLAKKYVEHSGPDGGAIVIKGYEKVSPDDWDDDSS